MASLAATRRWPVQSSTLKVYSRGCAYYSREVDRVSAHQWAMGRVRSFVTGKGGARKADKDLIKESLMAKTAKKGLRQEGGCQGNDADERASLASKRSPLPMAWWASLVANSD